MIIYVIEHKATGQLMPQMKNGKGYTHWNPSGGKIVRKALPIPRIFNTELDARRTISQWAANPNAYMALEPDTWYGPGEGYYLDSKPDGRSKNDLKVVKMSLRKVKSAERLVY